MSLDSLRACVHHMDEATSNLDDASLSLSSLVRRTHSNLRPRPQNQPYYRRRIMVQKELSSLVANELDMRQMELRHLFNELETIIANNLAKKKKLSLELRRKSQDLRKDLEHLTETEQFQHEESFAKVQVEHDNLTKLIEKTQNCLSQLREDEEKLMLEISDLEDQAAKEAAIIESSLKLDLKGELKQSDPVLQLTCIWEKLLAKRDQEKERLKDVLKEQKVRLQEIKNMEDENARERKRKITELEKQERSQEDMLRERKKLKMAISLAMNERNQLRDEKSGSELLSDDAIIEQATGEVNSQYATMQDTLKQIEVCSPKFLFSLIFNIIALVSCGIL